MTRLEELLAQLDKNQNSTLQFKQDFTTPKVDAKRLFSDVLTSNIKGNITVILGPKNIFFDLTCIEFKDYVKDQTKYDQLISKGIKSIKVKDYLDGENEETIFG